MSWNRDETEVSTPATPLYVHEKIHPAAFVDSLGTRAPAATLFEDFNNLPENAAFEWYAHRGNWQNRIVRGEARHVMASLLQKESMAGKVQMIYFDPPYGISFKSNMQADTRSRKVGEKNEDVPNDRGSIQAFRDTYKNGIHSYLDNIFRIAVPARELLHDTGSVFLQFGPENVHRLAILLDEIFGSENRVATVPFAKSGGTSSSTLPSVADYLLWYAKDRNHVKYHQLYEPLTRKEKIEHMTWDAMVELANGTTRALTNQERKDPDIHLPDGARIYRRMPLDSIGVSTTGRSDPYTWNGIRFPCTSGRHWSVSHDGLDRLAALGRLDAVAVSENGRLRWKRYEDEVPGRQINNLWRQKMSPNDLHYVVETAESVIERCILMATDPGDLVLDPTCGSGTTAFVAEKWGRRWITTDCSAVAVSLARQRVATGIFDYFLLQDSRDGAMKEAELSGRSFRDSDSYGEDPANGFVYERVPDVSAAILAYDRDAPPTLLVNRPARKPNTVRVSSPFTVESHSPHRYIDPMSALAPAADERREHNANARKAILNALEISGIRDERDRIPVEDIADWPPSDDAALITHLARVGSDKAAILIAPDDRTVSKELIDHAAELAAGIPSVRRLAIVGFEFEADARLRETERRGRLSILKVQANRDFQVGNLQDGSEDNAFVRIGEPDIAIEKQSNDEIVVEVLGYDTYDPATGQVRNGGPENVDCWMIDTEYDGKSFFARRIHFPGKNGDGQIKRLKRRLGKRIDPSLWDAMLSLRSAPFSRPKKGRIAVRIVTTTHTEMTAIREVK